MNDRPKCLILAGGLGTRMRSHFPDLPKALIPVAGKPFAHWQLSWLANQGVDVVYSVGYKADDVRSFVRDGSRWGLSVDYVEESNGLLGTGGAVRLAVDQGLVGDRFFVLYGDSYLNLELADVDQVFRRRRAEALMAVFRNNGLWDASNAIFDGARVVRYEKNLASRPPEMCFIDLGLSEFSTDVITATIPPGVVVDLAACMTELSSSGRLHGLDVPERFYEVGSWDGLQELEALLRDNQF